MDNNWFVMLKKHTDYIKLALFYKKYKNIYTNILRHAEKMYEKQFKSVSHDPKLTWQLINKITDSKTTNNDKIKTIISNGKLFNVSVNPKMVSNYFNSFIINVGKKLPNICSSSNLTLNNNEYVHM